MPASYRQAAVRYDLPALGSSSTDAAVTAPAGTHASGATGARRGAPAFYRVVDDGPDIIMGSDRWNVGTTGYVVKRKNQHVPDMPITGCSIFWAQIANGTTLESSTSRTLAFALCSNRTPFLDVVRDGRPAIWMFVPTHTGTCYCPECFRPRGGSQGKQQWFKQRWLAQAFSQYIYETVPGARIIPSPVTADSRGAA